MKDFTYYNPTKIIFGKDTEKEVEMCIRDRSYRQGIRISQS